MYYLRPRVSACSLPHDPEERLAIPRYAFPFGVHTPPGIFRETAPAVFDRDNAA